MFIFFVINSQVFIFFLISILFLYNLLLNINCKNIILLLNINFSFLFLKILYYNFFSIKFNCNYNYIIKKEIYVNDCFTLNRYKLLDYKYLYFLGIKYNLLFILNKHNYIYTIDFDSINKITINKKYYYRLILKLLFKYSKYFNKIDLYILNNIKEFIY